MNHKPHKQYTLDDGSTTTAIEVAERIGITLKNARTRLSVHSDPLKVFRAKQEHLREDSPESYKMRKIMKRGIYDEYFVLCFKTI
jgi:hypothetical protein